MSKVIQNIKSNIKSLSQNLSSLLHRGQKSKDPYKNNKRLSLSSVGLLLKTLGTDKFSTRCSSTFNSYINKNKNLRIAGFTSALSLAVLSVFFVYPIVKNLNSAEAATGTAKQSETTLTMTSGYTSANVELTPHDSTGTFASSTDAQSAKFSVTTNNVSGYELTIAGSDDTKRLNNSSVSGAYLDSITSTVSASAFNASTYNGKWGLKPSKYNSSDNTSFVPAPTTTSAATLDKTAAANSTANQYSIGLGARVDYSKPAGTYTNTFVLTATGNPITYTINYSKGDITDTVSNLPTEQTGSVSTTSITLSNTTPTRTGYTFLYWCLGATGNNATTCSGTTYNSRSTFGIDQTTANSTTLYAVWSPTITIKAVEGASVTLNNGTACTNTSTGCTVTGLVYNTSYNLVATITNTNKHSFTSWTKSNTATGTGTIAANSASTTYTVGSLPITITPTLTVKKYTCTKQYRLQGADGTWGNYTSDGTEQVDYGATCSYSKTVTDYKGSASGTNGSAATASGTMTASGITVSADLYRNTYTLTVSRNTTYISSASATTTAVHGSNYYRWGQVVSITASAATGGKFTSWSQSGTAGTFANANSASTTFTMGKGNATVTAGGEASAATMQSYTKATCQSEASNANKTLTDSRDNNTYTVRYINGNCWMTQNLRYMGDTVGSTSSTTTWYLKSATSNVSADKTMTMTDLTSGNSYDAARFHNSDDTSKGVWYNYAAASAMTITDSSNTGTQTYDICPKGWRLPTNSEQSGITGYSSAYSPVTGGHYSAGSLDDTGYGYWWSATSRSSTLRYYLLYNGSSLFTGYGSRYYGYYVRCVRSS